jgi:hypothetical protein
VEIFTLIKYLQNKYMQQNKSRVLDNIISNQIPHHERYRLGYNQKNKDSRSKTTEQRQDKEVMQKLSETFLRRKRERNLKKNIIETLHHPEDLEFGFSSIQL